MENLSKRISELSPEKRKLLELIRQEKRLQANQSFTITPRPDPESFPLSFSQQRLWFLDQWQPNSPAYNIPIAVQLRGVLDISSLNQAINEVYERHEVLRATFSTKYGQPIQTISEFEPIELISIDLTIFPQADRSSQVSKLVADEAKYLFDLTKGPLLRPILIKLKATEHILLLTMHHIVSDGWSMGILVHELATLYEAICNQSPINLPKLPIQYADFAYWQRQWMQAKNLEDQLSYWKEKLAGVPPMLNLPTDYPRPTISTFEGSSQNFKLSKPLVEKLKELASQENSTLFMILLASFQILLSWYSHQDDIVTGSPIANRNRAETEGLIGFFVNTLLIRTNITNSLTFRELLRRVRETTIEAYAHQDLPFEKLVEELNPERIPSHSPLFQVMFVLQNAPLDDLKLAGLTLSLLEVNTGTSKFDLLLSMTEENDEIAGFLEYSTDLFDGKTITRVIGYFQALLENIIDNPDVPLFKLQLLTDAEKHQLLIEWNNTDTVYQRKRLVHKLFEEQVQKSPKSPAVIFEGKHISYEALNTRANQLANYLQTIGIEPDGLVAIYAQRSVEMVLAILGVLKAGGAYIPIDPTYPKKRINIMLQDADTSILLTQKELAASLPECSAQVISLDADWEIIAAQSKDNPTSNITIRHAAYVIYTSGSTGKPKGVINTHGGILNRLLWMQETYNLTENDRVLQKTPFSFDVSVWEFLWPLITGASLVLARPEGHKDTNYLVEIISKQKVTTLHFVPSMLVPFLKEKNLQNCKCLKRVICSGEALSADLKNLFFERLGAELHNLYGPTEASIDVTYWPCQREDERQIVPIGYPIANTQIYILNSYLNPVPIGVPGELCIGGTGLARGYLNRPRLTAQQFIPNPFSREAGAFLYKTGDLARYLPDGSIEFLGRIDHQIKIRGYRIELGEIEAILKQYPSVQNAVVLNRKDTTGAERLIAYLIYTSKHQLHIGELRRFASEKLPAYMVPVAFVPIDYLPLTPNGKLDRKALPAPVSTHFELKKFIAPGTMQEEILAIIWGQVLGLEQVSVTDNYFALGGDSIRSIQIQSLARDRGINFSVQQLFTYQTIRELIQAIGTETLSIIDIPPNRVFSLLSEADRLKLPENIEDAYPFSMLQAGMIFDTERTANFSIYHDVFSFHLHGQLNIKYLQTAIEHIIVRHPALRTSFDLINYSEPLQLVYQTVSAPLQVQDLRDLSYARQEEIIDLWVKDEKDQGFKWDQPPLLRFHVYQRSNESFQFSLSCHNSILDGWSVASMLTELFNIYTSLLNGRKPAIQPSPESTIRDFIYLERKTQESEECRQYWSEVLDASIITTLPRLTSPSSVSVAPLKRLVHVLDIPISAQISSGLKGLARQAAVPLKSVLLAAHIKVMSLFGGFQSETLTGLVSNGRPESKDGEQVLGLFLNVLPFHLKLTNSTWIDLINQVFDKERELIPFRRYPISQLRIDRGGLPLFEVVFNFIHFHIYQGLKDLPDLQVLDTKTFDDGNHTLWVEFSVHPVSSQIHLQLLSNVIELDKEQVETIGNYYLKALELMILEPFRSHNSHSLLSEYEYKQLLIDWNDTKIAYPASHNIVQLFESQVESTPNAIAVICDEKQLTYRQLNKRANRLARELVKLGVSPEVPVGLLSERSLDFLTAILAIFKAGGVYLPLDCSYPAKRLCQIVEQTEVLFLLTTNEFLPLLSETVSQLSNVTEPPQILMLKTLLQSEQSTDNLETYFSPNHLAYIMHTSGSTGIPKSTMVEHEGMFNHFQGLILELGLTQGDIVAQTASQGFVISIWQFLIALLVGGKVCIFRDEIIHNPVRLIEQIENCSISVLEIVPSQLQIMLDEVTKIASVNKHALSTLRWMMVCGEALPARLCRRWFQFFPQIPMINAYGSVECSDDVTFHIITEPPPATLLNIAVGLPIGNMQTYVLGNNLSPVPKGVIGHIYIGGTGIGRGYLNNPRRTAEVFIPDPFSKKPGSRLYHIGDLGRYSPEGNLEFVGRKDHQVKIRGIRVELGEIESLLREYPTIREAVVLFRQLDEYQIQEKRLVAYVVTNQESSLDINKLREYLKQYLPDHILPSNYVLLDALPLSPNGKVKRKALPVPGQIIHNQEVPYVAPRSLIEELLADMWIEILGVERISLNDNFFELGGHSLLATQLISRVRKAFQIGLDLYSIFQVANLAELAGIVETVLADKRKQDYKIPPLKTTSRSSNAVYQLSYAQERLWFLNLLEPNSPFYNLHVAIRISGQFNVAAFEQGLNNIVKRHEILRTTFSILNGQPVQIIHTHLTPKVYKTSICELPQKSQINETLRIADETIKKSFDLNEGPLLRAHLIQISQYEHIVILVMHHIISDAWSMELFARELSVIYQAIVGRCPIPLKELPIQYVDFAYWQRTWLEDKVLEEQLSYWKNKLVGAPPLLELPSDRDRPLIQTYEGTFYTKTLPQELSDAIKTISRRENSTLFMTLLAAFQAILHFYTGSDDIVIGTDVANRNHLETEDLIGFFVNQLVLRADLSGNPTFRELLKRVRELSLEAYANQDVPFNRLVEALNPERNLGYSPLFQVKLVLQNVPNQELDLPDLELSPVRLDRGTTQLDLNLRIAETQNGLILSPEYSTDLFDETTIIRLLENFETVLRMIVKNSNIKLSELEETLTLFNEQHQLTAEKGIREVSLQKLKNAKRKN